MISKMPRPLWFKAKRYGYGWYPGTWQGWTVMLIWALFFVGAFCRWDVTRADPATEISLGFFADVGTSTAVLLVVCWYTGEKARWRWGK